MLERSLGRTALIVIPGPSVLFIIGRSLSLGRKGGLLSLIGEALGMLPAIALVSMGVGASVAESVVIVAAALGSSAQRIVYPGERSRCRGIHRTMVTVPGALVPVPQRALT